MSGNEFKRMGRASVPPERPAGGTKASQNEERQAGIDANVEIVGAQQPQQRKLEDNDGQPVGGDEGGDESNPIFAAREVEILHQRGIDLRVSRVSQEARDDQHEETMVASEGAMLWMTGMVHGKVAAALRKVPRLRDRSRTNIQPRIPVLLIL